MSEENKQDEKPSRNFLTRLYARIKELAGDKLSEDDFQSAVRDARSHAGGKAKAEKQRGAAAMAEMSYTRLIEMVNSALSQAFKRPFSNESYFYWAREIYPTYVIVCSNDDGKYYRISYTVSDEEVEFGEPQEVEQTFSPVAASEGVNVADLCSKGHAARLFNEFEFAEAPEWIPYLPKPGSYKHPAYGEIKITEERNGDFVSNFKAGVYQERLPVDAEHETKLSGAVGWITDMRVNEDGSADARVEWTDRGTALIEADRFKYVSPEFYDEWTDPATDTKHSDVAIGAALTTRPFFKESSLRPLVANERGVFAVDEQKSDPESHVYYFSALAPTTEGAPKAMAENKEPEKEAPKAVEESQTFAEMKTALQAAESRAEQAETEARQMSERVAALEREGRTRRFNDLITRGNWLGKPETHLLVMETFGEGTDNFKTYVEEQNAVAEQAKTAGLFAEVGSGLEGEIQGALSQLEKEAKAIQAAEPSLTYEMAYDRAMTENPDLVRKQREEARGAK